MKEPLQTTIQKLQAMQDSEYTALGDMADQTCGNAADWLDYLQKQQSTNIFAKDHEGMKVCCEGILCRSGGDGVGDRFMRAEMFKHLEAVANEYYARNIDIVDEFLQLYCIGQDARKAALAKAAEELK